MMQGRRKHQQITCCSATVLCWGLWFFLSGSLVQWWQNRHFSIFINLTAVLSGTTTDCRFLYFFIFAIRLLCVCVVILGIQTAVAIVTHPATCCALISVPRTDLSLAHPHSVVQRWKVQYDHEIFRPVERGKIFSLCLGWSLFDHKEGFYMATVVFLFLTAHLTAAE